MDLVIGATGLVGGAIAGGLRKRNRDVRAGVRGGSVHPKASGLSQAGITVVPADLTRPETLAPACTGIDTVISTANSIPDRRGELIQAVDHDGMLALIDAARQAGCRRFIYLSFSGGFDLESPLQRAKRAAESRLRASGMEAVILRPSLFMEVWLSPHLGFDAAGGAVHIPGDGTAPVRFVSAFDVAELAVAAAIHPAPAGTWEIGGPEALAPRDAISLFERALGKTIAIATTPESELLTVYETAADPLAKTFAAFRLGYARGDAVPDAAASAAKFGVALKSVGAYAAATSR